MAAGTSWWPMRSRSGFRRRWIWPGRGPALWLHRGFGRNGLVHGLIAKPFGIGLGGNLEFGTETREFFLQAAPHLAVSRVVVDASELLRILLQVEQFPIIDVGAVEVDEFVMIRDDAVMRADMVRHGKLVVVIVKT